MAMPIGTTRHRDAAVEEALVFVSDIKDFVARDAGHLEDILQQIEQAALLAVADQQGRVVQAEVRLCAERAALAELERKGHQVTISVRWMRSEFANAESETLRADDAIKAAAQRSGRNWVVRSTAEV